MRSSSVTTSGIGGEDVPRPCPRRRSRRPRGKSREVDAGLLLRAKESVGGTSRGQRAVQAGWRSVGISKPCSPTVEKEKIRAGERRTRRAFGRRDVVVRVARARKVSSGSRVVNETHLSGVEDVGVVGALDLLGALGGLEGDLVGHDGHAAGLGSDHGVLGAEGHAAGGEGGGLEGGGGNGGHFYVCVGGGGLRKANAIVIAGIAPFPLYPPSSLRHSEAPRPSAEPLQRHPTPNQILPLL